MARSSCIVMTGLWVFLLYFCAINADNSARHVKSLHLHREQNQRKNEPLVLNFEEGNIPGSDPLNLDALQGRFKRDTHGESNKSDKPASLEVFQLNDTHQQLMVHWAGEGSDVIMCLARDPALKNKPSTVFVSYDYGTSFVNKTENFKLSDVSQYAVLDKFYNHPKFNNHYIFVDSTNKAIFTSIDFAKTIRREDLEFQVSDLLFHEEEPETVVAIDKSTDNWKLWLTTDLGRSWHQIQQYVRSFMWHSFTGQPAKLYVQRQEPGGATTVLTSPSLFQAEGDISVVVRGVIDFEIKGDFMFATKKNKEDESSELLISRDAKTFVLAQFPTEQPLLGFYVADVAGNQVMVAVSHGPKLANLYVSEEITGEYVRFALSLPRILCYFPNTTWHTTWLKAVADESFADLHRVAGLGGIYIASQVTDEGEISNIGPEHLSTVISFDNGGEWRLISAPKVDDQGRPIKCDQNDGCSLHLSQRFSQLYPVTRSVPILSTKSAPGLIIATGTVGKSLKTHPAVFMSHDAGLTWKQVLNDYYLFNVGDHGGIVVAVKYFRSHGQTRDLLYSTDEGERWNNVTFYDDDLRIYGLMTEPGENTTIFTMFGSSHSKHQWLLIKIDLRHAFSYDCTKDDYKFWSPSSEVGPHMPCVLGRKETFERRIPHSNCYNGKDYDRPIKLETCECDAEDFECEFGFVRNVGLRQCIRNKTTRGDPYAVPASCKPGDTYNRTKGYRKITGDVCEGGNENHFLADEIPCPIKEQNEFLVVSQRERIGSISLSGKPQFKPYPIRNLKNVIAIEFDLKNNCLYWADIVEDVIKRQCMENGTSRPETLVETRLDSIEGMALDWVSNLLFFVDGARSAIEVIRTDVNHSGRMRKTILGSEQLKKPRGIAVHPMQGYIFWTDWAPGEPSVSRASMDGSDIKRLFVKPTVSWPNGITIDHIAERIYWVDAKEDYIASSDLEGHKFRKIIMKNERVAHPFSVAVFKDTMYWDDWKKNSVFMADKDHGAGITPLVSELQGLMDLKVFAHSVQEGTNACSNQTATGCTHICVGLPHGKFKCLCPDDMKVDGKSCLCASGEKPFANGTCPTASSTCSKDYFQCNNNACVPKLWECDGDNDCGDNADEMNCGQSTCVGNHFSCHSGKCIPSYWRCDFDRDCEDGSDELNCSYEECNKDQFKCNNGRCISQRWLCDQEDDCRDGSDETNCTSVAPVTCGAGEFRCAEKNAQCVPNTWRCDGEQDCPDGSDEKNCSSNICETWQFTCANNKCIFRSWLCDGDNDCKDNSDEVNCSSTSTSKPATLPPAFLPTNTCKEWMFSCKNRMCIPFWWKCDGIDDCGDGSDESACGFIPTPPSVTTSPKTTLAPGTEGCPANHFRCFNGDCIAQAWLCDGVADCNQAEDEEHCTGRITCRADQFTCRLDGSCVPISQVCDGKKQCPDGSDETGCSAKPDPTPGGVKCNVGFFACDEGSRCLPSSQVCDGHQDCFDAQDEASCTHNSSRVYQVYQVGVDERSIDATSVLLYWWIPVPDRVKFQFLPSYAEATPGATWKNQTEWVNNLQARIEGLKPYTNYNLTVYVKIKGSSTIFPPAHYASATTAEGEPSAPWNVRVEQLKATEVQVTWQPPASPNGRIQQYVVYMSPPIPPFQEAVPAQNTSKIIKNVFEIGQNYSFWVLARNTAQISVRSNVATLQYDGEAIVGAIEGVKVTGRTNNSVSLEWTTVQGVEGYYITPNAGLMYSVLETRLSEKPSVTVTNLAPGTTYTFNIRGYRKGFTGLSAHIISKTDGVALPRVPGLRAEVSKTQGTSVKLSWELPKDSRKEKWTYGIFYGATMKELVEKSPITTTELSGSVVQLQACESYIFDVAVVDPLGVGPLSGRAQSVFTQYTPGAAPKNLKAEKDPQNETKVLLSWNAPCPELNTKLGYRVYVKDRNQPEVKMMQLAPVDLPRVTHWFGGTYGAYYDIYVTTLEPNAVPSATESYKAPAIPAPHQLEVLPEKNGSYIVYWKDRELPNQVRSTKFHYEILVSEGRWKGEENAKKFNSTGPPFILKDVQEGAIYTVAIKLVTDNGYQSLLSELNSVEVPQGTWSAVLTPTSLVSVVVPVTLVILALAVALGFFMWRHRRLQNSFVSFANSHYDTRSGAATFSGGDGLDEEDDSPVIRGFSDDEPLVIA